MYDDDIITRLTRDRYGHEIESTNENTQENLYIPVSLLGSIS